MWALRHLREFCNTPEEHHAVCLGLLLTFPMWWLIARWGASDKASQLLVNEPWYVGLGLTLRMVGLILFIRWVF